MSDELAKAIATDTLMATLGEYDALWDGMLFPEIVDAEFHDAEPDQPLASLPLELYIYYDRQLTQNLDRLEALAALMGTVTAMVDNSLDVPLFEEGVDAELYDCPLNDETFFQCFVAPDFPTPRSLK